MQEQQSQAFPNANQHFPTARYPRCAKPGSRRGHNPHPQPGIQNQPPKMGSWQAPPQVPPAAETAHVPWRKDRRTAFWLKIGQDSAGTHPAAPTASAAM